MWLGGAVNICGKAVAGPQKKSVTSKIEHFCSREAAYSKKNRVILRKMLKQALDLFLDTIPLSPEGSLLARRN